MSKLPPGEGTDLSSQKEVKIDKDQEIESSYAGSLLQGVKKDLRSVV